MDAHEESYKRFRRRIILRSADDPAASTPLTTRGRCESDFEFDTVCQKLELDSPPRPSAEPEPAENMTQKSRRGRPLEARGVSPCGAITPTNMLQTVAAGGCPENAPEQGWVWTAAVHREGDGFDTGISSDLQAFSVLSKASMSPQEKALMKMAAPSLQNDYYTNLLDCSCNGMVALALGSSVYLWNSETRNLEEHLHPSPTPLAQMRPGRPSHQSRAISSLCWSTDGRALCIGGRQGVIQLWDVEYKRSVRCLPAHLSVIGALSWKQHLLSSGSDLGHIHHYDPRAPAPLVGTALQQGAVCSLQWSPGGDRLASGSTDGLLHVWDSDITGLTKPRHPVMTMTQPSSVKAMGWCPWQRQLIATGGGWRDGELRIWDTESGTCITSTHTHTQICSLRWAEKKRVLLTGHGLPHHRVTCWAWGSPSPSLRPSYQLTGHSHRVLHLALSPCETQVFSAGADQCVHIWAM
ncbi:cell division cycle protein 20 homolog B-like [Genypterus blacodes]|uniref:cell division cycle protein 20 homolog B-like n=1 Tax=Genypterus blacodes TaxID=154954 RepID=UPI003F76ACF7